MAADFEFFDELRRHLDEEAARLIAQRTAPMSSLATKDDIATIRDDLRQTETRMYRWMLTLHASQWLAMVGMIVAIVLKG